MARVGVVLETMGEHARVTTARRGVCEECDSGHSCSVGTPGGGPAEVVLAINEVGARTGDTVSFDLPGHGELKLSMLVWGVPIVGMVGGAVAGAALHASVGLSSDPAAVLGAVAGFLVAFGLIRIVDRRMAGDRSLEPHILQVVSACGADSPEDGFLVRH